MNLARIIAAADGVTSIQLIAGSPFYTEEDLPFRIHGAGVLRIEPDKGFQKESLAATADERLVIADCPDAPGWLVPEGIVAHWMARNVTCPELEDLLLAHPLYEHLTRPDDRGHSRGHRLLQWVPGIPEMAVLRGPERVDDVDAPEESRDPATQGRAVEELLASIHARFPLVDVDVSLRFDPAHEPF